MRVKGVVLKDRVGMRLVCTGEAGDKSYCRTLRGEMAVSTCGEQETSVLAWRDGLCRSYAFGGGERRGRRILGKDCVFLLTPNMNDLSHLKIKTPCIHCSPNYTLNFHTTIENAFQNMIWLVNSILLAPISLPLVASLNWRI